MTDEANVHLATAHYPPADITPAEFEEFVTQLFTSAQENIEGLAVRLHEKIRGVDGTYDFDATVRYELAGMSFLVLVEAKKHKNPIKRELVQVLYQKVQSVGAQKGVMISTAPYQIGAVEFAKTHGVALVTVTEGRFTFEARGGVPVPPLSRQQAAEQFNSPTFVGHHYGPGGEPGSTSSTLMSPEYPEYIVDLLLASPVR
ncbi:restriction endonuclease [Streptomyces antibioticus]|uniref:restriction endonuclease n=1 Tax=Streptomyces antibioticus TaxID=1890 RepID=UPI0037A07A72